MWSVVVYRDVYCRCGHSLAHFCESYFPRLSTKLFQTISLLLVESLQRIVLHSYDFFSYSHLGKSTHTHSTQARQRRHVTRSFTLKNFFPLSFQLGRDTFWQNGQLVHKSNVLLRRASTAGKSKILYIHWTVHSIHGKCILLDFHHFECNKLPFLVYLAIKASKLAANNLKCILLIRFGPNFIVSPVPGCLTGPRIKTQLI